MPEVDPNTPNPNTPDPNKPNPPDEAAKERERLLTENASLRKAQKDAEAERQRIADENAALKKAGHKTTGDWQKVAETAETEAKTWREKHEKAQAAFVNTLVGGKVREEALKQGLKPDLVDLLDSMAFDEIEAGIEDGKFNVKGTDTAIANLKRLRPSLFQEAQPPRFNAGGAGTPPAAKTLEDAKNNYLAALKNRFKDPQKFNQAHLEYQKALSEARKAKK